MGPAAVLTRALRHLGEHHPLLVAIDGHNAAGKSTLAAEVASKIEAVVIDGDDFYAGGTAAQWDEMSPAEKADHCIDWRRQRPLLEMLKSGETVAWHPYDWDIHDGRLAAQPRVCAPAPVIILEGVYSARPELADLMDLRVLYEAPPALRRQRWKAREGEGSFDDWTRRWSDAEDWYFSQVMPSNRFDLVLSAV